jgi:hypothetical protein
MTIYLVYSYCELRASAVVDPRSANNLDEDVLITKVYKGLEFPTAMGFLDDNDILVAEMGVQYRG